MNAQPIVRDRIEFADDAVAHVTIWQVSQPLPVSEHPYKYRLAYVVNDECVLRYDNESGKGDHRQDQAKPRTASPAFGGGWTIFGVTSRGGIVTTVLFEISSPRAALERVAAELEKHGYPNHARITFRSPESMARVLTPTRWTIVQVMTGAGPIGVRELARRVQRDVKGVHNDANALLTAGIIDRTDDGKYLFPFDEVKVNFELRPAA